MTDRLSPLIRFETKRALSTEGEFEGFASTWGGPPDSYGDIIARGAFRDALAEHARNATRPALLWSHDAAQPLGVWQHLEETEHGLLARGKLSLGLAKAREAHELMKAGALALSIGFSVAPGGSRESKGVREITKIGRLAEISLVSMPANSRAAITGMKAPATPREFERVLRDAGLSARQAKAATAAGWRGISARDEHHLCDTDLHRLADVLLERVAQNKRSVTED